MMILHAYIPAGAFVAEMPEFAARAGQAAWARLPLVITSVGEDRAACPFSVSGEPTFVDAVPLAPG